MGGYDLTIVHTKLFYAALQLGIFILNETVENLKTLNEYQKMNLEGHRKTHGIIDPPYIEYKCYHGDEYYMEIFKYDYIEYYQRNYEYEQCPFYLRYEREVITDQASPYRLIEFDMTHTHPLGFHTIMYGDLMGSSLGEEEFRSMRNQELKKKAHFATRRSRSWRWK